MPETYGADTAAEADVVYTNGGVKNGGAVEEFLYKVGLGVPCQLRTVQDYGEGAVMVIDTVYEHEDAAGKRCGGTAVFLHRHRRN